MIPEPKGFNALLGQKFFPRFIPLNSAWQTVLKTVEFDIQLRGGAIKIQDISTNCVLSAKFETGELAFTQCLPKFFFFGCLLAAKFAGDLLQTHTGRMLIVEKKFKLLTPALSSLGEERETSRARVLA